jgi:hypothetical protein
VPFDYEIVGNPPLAILRGVGPVQLEMWEATMQRLVADPRFTEGLPILVDVTEVGNLPLPGEAAIAAIRWRAMAPKSRGAILATGEVEYAVASQVEQITSGRIRAFTDRAAAMAWLLT